MIEGFPRSGDSFGVQAFAEVNAEGLSEGVAIHLQSAAHVGEADRIQVPAMVFIRAPADAVVSTVALGAQAGIVNFSNDAHVKMLLRDAARKHMRFHRAISALSESVRIVNFEDVKADFGAVTAELNKRFGTSFR